MAIVVFVLQFGHNTQVAADTKHDLLVNPAGFLRGALTPWTDAFTLGQLQNQAYGYLFPHGLFFLATDPLPEWVALRLWWLLVTGVGFSGAFLLARRATDAGPGWSFIAALAYALSPRTLTTLTTISSETWAVMLAPWVLVACLAPRSARWQWAAAVIPVALMGAVNATATLAACIPAAVVLLCQRRWRFFGAWLAGCALVSAWWILPLLVLGRFAAPFTQFIESAFVTTRWLNLVEILRGTTSWSPFVDTERTAGVLLVAEPVFVLATVAVAAAGLVGLCRLPRTWSVVLIVGVAVLGTSLPAYRELLDGPLAALRNLHKFDPLVRLPLVLGLAQLGARLGWPRTLRPDRRQTAGLLLAVVVAASAFPALSGRLLPRGAYEEVPSYWTAATDFLNEHAAGTRTLIYPPASFARQDWGWTRDEPAQPLLEVPWAVRDAIPLIPPEAIRGLDGITAALEHDAAAGAKALQRLGIGAVLLRHDLDEPTGGDSSVRAEDLPGTVHTFGEVDVVLLDPQQDLQMANGAPVRVAGGGEVLALLDMVDAPGARELVDADADIVTDTPLLVDRNYGTLDGPVSAPLAEGDRSRVHNRLRDYPSAGRAVAVEEHGGRVVAESSAADADSFGGANPACSVTAAVDGQEDTAWWPVPGQTGWLEIQAPQGEVFASPVLRLTATDDARATVSSGSASVEVELSAGEETTVRVPGGDSTAVRITPHERVGINAAEVAGHPIERVVTVPDTSPNVEAFFFQRLTVDTGTIIRDFTAPRDMELPLRASVGSDADTDADEDTEAPAVRIDGRDYRTGETVRLPAGTHRLETAAAWVQLGELPRTPLEPTGEVIAPADHERLLITGRAYNAGLNGWLDDASLQARQVDAATQAFVIPAGASGTFRMTFAATGAYQAGLLGGGALGLLTVIACAVVCSLGRGEHVPRSFPAPPRALCLVLAAGGLALVGWPALLAGIAAFAAVRWTTLPAPALSAALLAAAGAMLARAPWPSAGYAGDSVLVTALCAGAIACVFAASSRTGHSARTTRAPGRSTHS